VTEHHDQSRRYFTPRALAESLGRPEYSPEKDLFLAEIGGHIVGFCNVTPELRIGRVILDCMIHPKHRRKGIATNLLQYGLKRAKEHGARVAQAEIPEHNPAAKLFVSDTGFRAVHNFYEMGLELTNISLPSLESSLTSRSLKNGEENKLTEIQNRCFTGTWGFNPNTIDEIVHRVHLSGCSPEDVILFYHGNELIGYCWILIKSEENLALGTSKGLIHMMGVDPDSRGKGYGRALLLAGLGLLKERGITHAELSVDSENEAACALYKSAGFEIFSTTEWYEKTLD
jgi:mycothiol synthase